MQIPSEYLNGVSLGFFGQLPTDLSFKAGEDQTIHGIFGHGLEKVRVRMIG